MEETLGEINKVIQNLLESPVPILMYKDRGDYLDVEVDVNNLNQIPMPNPENPGTSVGDEQISKGTEEEGQEIPETEEETEKAKEPEEDTVGKRLEKEAFAMKDDMDYVTELIENNLDKQIDRLERLAVGSPKAKEYIREMEILRRQMRKVKKGQEKLEDYVDFILYVGRVADRSQLLVDKIRKEYSETWKTQSPEERAKTLRKTVELQETLSAFYSKEKDKSLLSMLSKKIYETPGNIDEDARIMLEAISDAENAMRLIDESYMETIIPILVIVTGKQ